MLQVIACECLNGEFKLMAFFESHPSNLRCEPTAHVLPPVT